MTMFKLSVLVSSLASIRILSSSANNWGVLDILVAITAGILWILILYGKCIGGKRHE